MDDIQRALAAAWRKIRPRLERDETELRRRLLRRRSALLQSPPRAWCLAIRAADTRLCDETRVPLTPAELPRLSFIIHRSSIIIRCSILPTPSPSMPTTSASSAPPSNS